MDSKEAWPAVAHAILVRTRALSRTVRVALQDPDYGSVRKSEDDGAGWHIDPGKVTLAVHDDPQRIGRLCRARATAISRTAGKAVAGTEFMEGIATYIASKSLESPIVECRIGDVDQFANVWWVDLQSQQIICAYRQYVGNERAHGVLFEPISLKNARK